MRTAFLAIALLAVGCQGEKPNEPAPANPIARDLTSKLKGMTPQERTEYLKKHPDEAMAAIGGPAPKPR